MMRLDKTLLCFLTAEFDTVVEYARIKNRHI